MAMRTSKDRPGSLHSRTLRAAPALLGFVVLLAAAPALRAQDVLETLSGSRFAGTVVSSDGEGVEFATTDGATMKLPWVQLTPKSQYRVKLAGTGPDAKSQLALAEWCVTTTLYEEARNHFKRALAADALMAPEINERIVVARRTAATELLARGKRLQAEHKDAEARHVLATLVQELPLEDASREAEALLAAETAQRKQDALVRSKPAAPPAGDPGAAGRPTRSNGEPFSDATRAMFQPIIDSYQKMLDATHKGLVLGGSAGINEFEKAIKEGDRIRKAADKLRPGGEQDAEVTEALALVDSRLEEAVVDVRIDLVDCYLLRSSYNQAASAVKLGLAQYPKNPQLRQAMDRVTAASAENSGGGWVVGGAGGGRLR
jgi:hypothetical protein